MRMARIPLKGDTAVYHCLSRIVGGPFSCLRPLTLTSNPLRQVLLARREWTSRREGVAHHGNRARKTALGSVIGATSNSVSGRSVQVRPCGVKVPF